jgi:hypothetical protein
MIHREEFDTRSEAMIQEHRYKTGTGHNRTKKLIAEYLQTKRLLHPPTLKQEGRKNSRTLIA